MYRYALPFPVLPGKSDADPKAIAEYFRAHPDDYRESRTAAGVTLERAYLQKTPMGSFVVAYIESEGDATSTFAASADFSKPLNRKFAEYVKEFHGIDLTQPAPPVEVLASWRDDGVSEGHTLEVLRMQPEPRYLGTVRILEVSGAEAVGKFIRPPFSGDAVREGDDVASTVFAK